VAVLGAGLQGACVALELASRGVAVDLYDKNERAVSQASASNEGRIHLGYVYSHDRSLDTARVMARGALAFAPLLRRWIGAGVDRIPVSAPYYYAVHRDSLEPAEHVERHLAACADLLRDEAGARAVDYLGIDCLDSARRITSFEHLFDPRCVEAVFATPEIAVDPQALAAAIRDALAGEPRIRCLLGATVIDAAVGAESAEIEFEVGGERLRERYRSIVNTLWDGRLALDAKLGLRPERPWLFRMKYFIRARPAASMPAVPSSTIVLGPFGAAVRYGDGELYLSWYPAGMRATCAGVEPPAWPRRLEGEAADEVSRDTLRGLGGVVPSIAGMAPESFESSRVEGGVIFAWGSTDIDDASSRLHRRSEIGVSSRGRYHSIDTGKLSMAPLFASVAAERILAA
jgi:hypothetical protein